MELNERQKDLLVRIVQEPYLNGLGHLSREFYAMIQEMHAQGISEIPVFIVDGKAIYLDADWVLNCVPTLTL